MSLICILCKLNLVQLKMKLYSYIVKMYFILCTANCTFLSFPNFLSKWNFSVEDTYEQVHLIFHMWIGLFYSKPTSRFFHLDNNSPFRERKQSPKVSDNIQASSPLTDVGGTFKEDKTSSLHPVTDVLDLSVRATEPSNHCTVSQGGSVENPTSISDIRSRQEHTAESIQQPLLSSCNSPSISKLDAKVSIFREIIQSFLFLHTYINPKMLNTSYIVFNESA